MALSLPGERSVAAGSPFHPFAAFSRWLAANRAARARRVALSSLLELDEVQLRDLGIARHDVVQALRHKNRAPGPILCAARARNAGL